MKLNRTIILVVAGCGAIALALALAGGEPATEPVTEPTSSSSTQPATSPTTASTTNPTTTSTMYSSTTPAIVPATMPAPTAIAAQVAATSPAGAATVSRPNGGTMASTTTRPMSSDFAVLKSRSMFLKGRAPAGGGDANSPATREAPKPEDSVIFNGVTDADGAIVAFLEDTSSNRIMHARVGDVVARGRVTSITLSTLQYESGGKVTSVQIGQALSGTDSSGASTQPTTSSSSGDSGGANDVLERMRRARQQGR